MALTPLDVQKMRFTRRVRGYDQAEVEDFLTLMAEELALRLQQLEKLEREVSYFRLRLEEATGREHQLQETLVRAQKVADEIAANAKREAELMIRDAEGTADRIVHQAVEQATRMEARITELRTQRREVHLRFKNTLDLFRQVLEAEMADDRSATVHSLPRNRAQGPLKANE